MSAPVLSPFTPHSFYELMRRPRNLLLLIFMVGGLIYGGLLFFRGDKGVEEAIPLISVEADIVRYGSLVRRINIIGKLVANQHVIIRPQISGQISAVLFKEGDKVKENQILIKIDDRSYQAQVKEAKAQLDQAEADYRRQSNLLAKNSSATTKTVEEARAKRDIAEARYETQRLNLDHTIVKAPFEGKVAFLNWANQQTYSVGTSVDQRTDLLVLVDEDPLWVEFRVPAIYLSALSLNQKIRINVDGFQDKALEAEIKAIDPLVDTNAHSVAVRAMIPNQNGLLQPGLFARIDLVLGARDNVLIIPEAAVFTQGTKSYVYIVSKVRFKNGEEKEVVLQRPILTGLTEDEMIEVVEGLKENDKVVTVGHIKLHNGYPVKIVQDASLEELKDQVQQEKQAQPE